MNTVIIDNYDSFTYNLVQLVAAVTGSEPQVIKNDAMTYSEFAALDCDNIIISPGPGNPNKPKDFGICAEIIAQSDKPILGVCLGHQGIAAAFGAKVQHADRPMHGRLATVTHHQHDLFQGVPTQFKVVRYHSLTVAEATLPDYLQVIARADDDSVMAIAHDDLPIYGVQFHPESAGSDYGHQLINNFMQLSQAFYQAQLPVNQPSTWTMHVQQHAFTHEAIVYFQALYAQSDYAVWLDSSSQEGGARFSYMADVSGAYSYHLSYDCANQRITVATASEQRQFHSSLFDYLKKQLRATHVTMPNLPFAFKGGFIGYLAYGLAAETLVQEVQAGNQPDAEFLFVDRFLVFDHQEQQLYCVCLDQADLSCDNKAWFAACQSLATSESMPFTLPLTRPLADLVQHPEQYLQRPKLEYLADIAACQAYINDGDSYEVCLTNQLRWQQPGWSMLAYYQQLRNISPTPYAAYLQFADLKVASASMECFMRVDARGKLTTKPIKGTTPRHLDPEADQLAVSALQHDMKFFSENMMIVDLLRNDLNQVCEVGSVEVTKLMQVESYAHVHQLVSTVQGQLKSARTAVDGLRALFPGGSITGAPKRRTVKIINELEQRPRGIYTGAIGYLSLDGAADFSIVIRTLVQQGGELSLGVGGAIIALSDPVEEYEETLLKAQSALHSLKQLLS